VEELPGEVSLSSTGEARGAELRVDYARRRRVAPNHTMTHVLNFALREVGLITYLLIDSEREKKMAYITSFLCRNTSFYFRF